MKLQISHKKEGDGFQCDAICNRGYTCAFWFCHGDPPVLPSWLDDLKLPPTARRVVWLAQQLPSYWTRIYMDNLFNSQKLFAALYRVKALAHGVMRTSGREGGECRQSWAVERDNQGSGSQKLNWYTKHASGVRLWQQACTFNVYCNGKGGVDGQEEEGVVGGGWGNTNDEPHEVEFNWWIQPTHEQHWYCRPAAEFVPARSLVAK